jgi:hypothetical protein
VVLIAITACGDAEMRRRSLAYGFAHYLLKPVDPGFLEKLLGGWHERLLGFPPRPRGPKGTRRMPIPPKRDVRP